MSSVFQNLDRSVKESNKIVQNIDSVVKHLQYDSIALAISELREGFSVVNSHLKECVLKCSTQSNITEKEMKKFPDEFESICKLVAYIIQVTDESQVKRKIGSLFSEYSESISKFLYDSEKVASTPTFFQKCEMAKSTQKVMQMSKEMLNLIQMSSPVMKQCLQGMEISKRMFTILESAVVSAENGTLTDSKSAELVVPSECSKQIIKSVNIINQKSNFLGGTEVDDKSVAEVLPLILSNLEVVTLKSVSYAVFLGAENKQDQLVILNDCRRLMENFHKSLTGFLHGDHLQQCLPEFVDRLEKFKQAFEVVEKKSDSIMSLGKTTYTLKAAVDLILEPKYLPGVGVQDQQQYPDDSFMIKPPQEISKMAKKISENSSKIVKAVTDKKKAEVEKIAAEAISENLDLIDQLRVYYTANLQDQAAVSSVKTARECVKRYCKLLETSNSMMNSTNDSEYKSKITELNKEITELSISLAKSTASFKAINPDGTTTISTSEMAKIELANTVKAIEAAATKLASLQPKSAQSKRKVDEELQWDEQILEAAKFITNAVKSLVTVATSSQQNFVEIETSNARVISAARMVSESTDNLTESVKQVLSGVEGSRSQLADVAKTVADATNRLISACGSGGSITNSGNSLQAAGTAVKQATDMLAHSLKNLERRDKRGYGFGGVAVDADAQEELTLMELICQKEAALVEAKKMLADFEDQLSKLEVNEDK